MQHQPDYLKTLSKDTLIKTLQILQKEQKIKEQDIKKLITKSKIITLPSYIFIKELSALESICKYLKEICKLSYHNIAQLLNRNDRTIWTTYNNARKKEKEPFAHKKILFTIPVTHFADRTLSVLETLVKYLKEEYEMNYKQIGEALQRNERTIWTVYQRAKKK